ncbi:MAG: DUF3179 domain-containing protein [Dehalococcoidia bacterium]
MRTTVLLTAVLAGGLSLGAQPAVPPVELFFAAASLDERTAREALDALAPSWRDGYTPMIVDLARLLRPAAPEPGDTGAAEFADRLEPDSDIGGDGAARDAFAAPIRRPPTAESQARARLVRFLEQRTGKRFDPLLRGWRQWMWSLPYEPHPDYARFKAELYGRIDQRMALFFPAGVSAEIRLDEIDWGGVTVNGIPPLNDPKVLPAGEAGYLRDRHVVFGLVVNGEARAYPKRILAWHEMARDRLGGVELHVVYCTLCGTVIPYESVAGGRTWRLGTSGLLYRSNKLMFDQETASLWSTLEGRPVVGELVGTGLQLRSHPVVTTTWGEWRAAHPATTVLSLDTGHQRDYSEGAAYRDYFSHDDLYFQVPGEDRRLKHKAEVLTLRVRPVAGGDAVAVAIDQRLLRRQRVYPLEVAGRRLVVVTSRAGANRVYALGSSDVAFQGRRPDEHHVVDGDDRVWQVTEDALVRADDATTRLPRVVAQRAFWFGWQAQFPDTLLVK